MNASIRILASLLAVLLLSAAARAGVDDEGNKVESIMELAPYDFDAQVGNGSAWLVEFHAPWCPRCKQLAPVLRKVASNLQDSDIKLDGSAWNPANLSYAVGSVDTDVEIVLGLRFMVLQYPTLYGVCGRHAVELTKRGAAGITEEMRDFAESTCWRRHKTGEKRSYRPTDVAGVMDWLSPLSPRAVWHSLSFYLLGHVVLPVSMLGSPFAANVLMLVVLAMLWLLPLVIPIVGLLVRFCDGPEEPQTDAEREKQAEQKEQAEREKFKTLRKIFSPEEAHKLKKAEELLAKEEEEEKEEKKKEAVLKGTKAE